AQGVECTDRRPLMVQPAKVVHPSAQHVADPLFHLPRGLVGEGDGADGVGRNALANDVRHPTGNDACLARTGAGDDQQRSVDVRRGLGLLGGEVGKKLLGVDHEAGYSGQTSLGKSAGQHDSNTPKEPLTDSYFALRYRSTSLYEVDVDRPWASQLKKG